PWSTTQPSASWCCSGGNDTWTYDGTTWAQQFPATSPPVRDGASMAYDPAIGKVVLFGGENPSFLGDTWTYDGTWAQQFPATSPPARGGLHGLGRRPG
ncbi:MAG TPA: hypothetical protein VKY15_06770, partial [Acidimicrobiales bacterium]|nr:hypothetical protein [Acidimicrobiales bacterium]